MSRRRSTCFSAQPRGLALLVRAAVATLCGTASFAHAQVLPSGGHFVAGNGSISASGRSLTINQRTARGIVEWNTFSIGNGDRVKFDNGSGATLNRVTGSDLSSILGTLSATGSVYLVNPQGIVIGRGGVVSTGGRFVASTLDTDNTSFMNAGQIALIGASDAKVVNLGRIGSTSGDVFLIADRLVENRGSIRAPNGTVELAAGEAVLLQDSSAGKQVFVALGDRGSVLNSGTIRAAQISLQAADGNVFALSGNHSALRATGKGTRDGHVWLLAETGKVELDGRIVAGNANGTGGTVDTTAATLAFCPCVPAVLAGVWNVTLPNVTIDAHAATSFSRSLNAGTTINVLATGRQDGAGNIDVASPIGWQGSAQLTLNAYRNVGIDKGVTIRNDGAGSLTLRADATGIDDAGSVTNNGTIDWSRSRGLVAAYYDMKGAYAAGRILGNPAWSAPLYSGLKTQVTAYQWVNSADDLNALGATGNYALGADIALSRWAFVRVDPPFTGQLDGMGHTISGAVDVGNYLFATIGQGGVVRNLNITNADEMTLSKGVPSGILAGDNQGTIVNVFVSGTAQGDYFDYPSGGAPALGGLVGTNEGTIVRSGANVRASNGGLVGGLVGQNSGLILQSYATGAVSGITNPFSGVTIYQAQVGGLAGANSGTISQSYATGSVSLTALEGGGLVAENSGTITQSFATGSVSGVSQGATTPSLGGVAALNTGTIGADVYWNKDTTGQISGGPGVVAANGLTTAQMSNPASFDGWDFGPGGVWAMPPGATAPVLEWQVSGH